jgi:cytochrome P450
VRINAKGSCEFASEFAAEFVLLVFLSFLGVPPEDRHIIKRMQETLPQGGLTPDGARSSQIEELTYSAR